MPYSRHLLTPANFRHRPAPISSQPLTPASSSQATHLHCLIQDGGVQVVGDESRTDTLDLVGAGGAAADDRGLGGLHSDDLRSRVSMTNEYP